MDSEITLKSCTICLGLFPSSHYSLNKYSSDKLGAYCKACQAQRLRLFRRRKYTDLSPIPEDICIRNFDVQNQTILQQALKLTNYECLGYSPSDKQVYKVIFGKSTETGLQALTLFTLDGQKFREFSYSNLDDMERILLDVLKSLRIRLERDHVTLHEALKLIYYI